MTLTQEQLKAYLHYDPASGKFTWLKASSRRTDLVGKPAGCVNARGYFRISVLGKSHLSHRLAFLYMTGRFPTHVVDHINGDPSDNSWANIREATQSQNLANQKARNLRGVKNVYPQDGKWVVRLMVNKTYKTEGLYATLEEAANAAKKARKAAWGEFARE